MRGEVIVVGLGAMGAALSWQLARRGLGVIAFDRYAPPHDGGSTHGESRITRLAVGEGDEYVSLVRRSHELWREIEAESGCRLLTQTGGIVIGGPQSDFVKRTRDIAVRHGIAHETLDGTELRKRFPMFAAGEAEGAYYGSTPLRTASCLYTSTPGYRFVIDRHPAHDNVMIVSACSGHGFKHSAAVGEAVAQWIAGEPAHVDLQPFQYPRAG